MNNKRKIWKNGKILSEKDAVMSIYDAGCMSGYVFEMTRSFAGKHFLLREHIERLFRSMKYIGLEVPYTVNDIINACELLSKENIFESDMEHRLVINASHGVLGIYQDVEGIEMGPYIMITDIPLKWTVRGMGKLFDEGINLITPSQQAIPSRILSNKAKHHNRLHFLRANIEVSQSAIPNSWAVLLDEKGYLTECVGANIFLIKGNTLYTPTTENILDGISRNYIIKKLVPALVHDVKLNVVETDLMIYDAINADEIFVCATPFCMLPVTSFNGQKIGTGKMGNITSKLLKVWSDYVTIDIPTQIKDWNNKYKDELKGFTPYQFTKK